jgi:hypothetical protein
VPRLERIAGALPDFLPHFNGDFIRFGSKLLLTGDNAEGAETLWISDGTSAGTITTVSTVTAAADVPESS